MLATLPSWSDRTKGERFLNSYLDFDVGGKPSSAVDRVAPCELSTLYVLRQLTTCAAEWNGHISTSVDIETHNSRGPPLRLTAEVIKEKCSVERQVVK